MQNYGHIFAALKLLLNFQVSQRRDDLIIKL